LAVAVVGSIGHRFTGGGAFVDLVGVVPGFVAQSVAEAFGVGELPLRSHVDAVVGRIGVSAPLLVVDNGDRLIDETCEVVSRLLVANEHSRLLCHHPPPPTASGCRGAIESTRRQRQRSLMPH
jgi:predicted ATPase